jgi:feruloyl esterase
MGADPRVHDFFRYFEAPGVAHCYSGSGLYPQGILDSLVKWVEHGVVPDTLLVDLPGKRNRILCPYPQKSRYNGTGNIWSKDSYYCK